MKITDLLATGQPTFSFEFFPPKNYSSILELGINVGQLMKLSPSFISVTYGAGGTTQDTSFDLVDYLQNKVGLCTAAHYTCVSATRERVLKDMEYLHSKNIDNLVLLRGDPPKGENKFVNHAGDFQHASDLVRLVMDQGLFNIGAAGYPEVHPESSNPDDDIKYLKYKVDQGVDFIITQLFFDNSDYYKFVDRARKAGITIPIIPGIMPATNFNQVKRFTDMIGVTIPSDFVTKLEKHKDKPSKTYDIGVEFAIDQCEDLLHNGAPGLHFYTLNKSRATVDIYSAIRML